MSSLKSAAEGWLEANAEMEAAEEKRDEYATVLERIAHKILKDRHAYKRTGTWPHVVEIEGDKVRFGTSNGIDSDSEMGVTFTLAELEAEGGDRLFHPSEYEKGR